MIGVDSPSQFDLRFSLGPIPVRVGIMFWVIIALFGYGWCSVAPGNTWVNLLIWMACGFVSILIHELGHALTYRLFGSWASITLHGFGGYALSPEPPRVAWKRMLVSLAGPFADFALFGLVLGLAVMLKANNVTLHVYAENAIAFLFWLNIIWGLFNLLPIRPLDGGNVLRELSAQFGARNPDLMSHSVGFVLALLLAVIGGLRIANIPAVNDALPGWFVYFPASIFTTLWFALLAYHNYQAIQATRRRRYYEPPDDYDDDTPPWRRR